jgi:hypothetical protein
LYCAHRIILAVCWLQWYDAVINGQEGDEEFLVTFPEYGNQEVVTLGDLMAPQAPKPASRDRCASA